MAEGATLTHVRLQDEAPGAFHLSTFYAEVAARGTYDSFALNARRASSRARKSTRAWPARSGACI